MTKIIFMHTINHFKQFIDLKADFFSNSQIQIFAIDIELRLLLNKKKIQYNVPENFIYETEINRMREATFNISYNWHNDFFKFKDISLGRLDSWNYIYYFARIIRNLKTILNIIIRFNPDELISFIDQDYLVKEFNSVLEYVCKMRNIKITILPLEKGNGIQKTRLKLRNSFESLIYSVNSLPTYTPVKLFLKPVSNLLKKYKKIQNQKVSKNLKYILIEGYHRNIELMNNLSREINIQVLLLDRSESLATFFKNIINCLFCKKTGFHIFFEFYKTKKIKKEADKFLKANFKKWRNYIKESKFKNQFKYENISFWPIVSNYIKNSIFIEFRRFIENILTNIRLYKKENIDLITVNDDVSEFTKTMASVTSKMKIQSLVLQRGATQYFYDLGFLPLTAEKIAVWGETSKKNLNDNGLPFERMIITGAPNLDKYFYFNQNDKIKEKIKNSVYKDFGLEKDKKLIVYTAGHLIVYRRIEGINLSTSEFIRYYELILNTVKELPESHLIIKLHYAKPHNRHIIETMIKNLKVKNVTVVLNYNIENLLIACDCLVSGWSTTGIEGLYLNKPLIVMVLRKRRFPIPYMEEKAAFGVSNVEDFKSKLKIVFKNPIVLKEGREVFLRNYLHKLDGLSIKRVSNLIKKMIGSS